MVKRTNFVPQGDHIHSNPVDNFWKMYSVSHFSLERA